MDLSHKNYKQVIKGQRVREIRKNLLFAFLYLCFALFSMYTMHGCIKEAEAKKVIDGEYTRETYFRLVSEQFAPMLGDPTPARQLFQNDEDKSSYTLFTSYDWPGKVVKCKFIYKNTLVICLELYNE